MDLSIREIEGVKIGLFNMDYCKDGIASAVIDNRLDIIIEYGENYIKNGVYRLTEVMVRSKYSDGEIHKLSTWKNWVTLKIEDVLIIETVKCNVKVVNGDLVLVEDRATTTSLNQSKKAIQDSEELAKEKV